MHPTPAVERIENLRMARTRAVTSLAVVLAVVLAATACGTSGTDIATQVHLQGEYAVPEPLHTDLLVADTMHYLVWLPEGYGDDRTKEWPLIVFLHGSGDEDYDAVWVQSYGLPAVLHLAEQPDPFPFVVLSPQAAPGSAWWTGNTIDVLDSLVGHISHTYLIDDDRVYLTGLSMGGYGSWFLAQDHHERFAAMVSLSGSGWRQPVLPPGDICGMADLPIRAIHGSVDLISDPAANEQIVTLYRQVCDADVTFEWIENAGHFETYEAAYRDPALYDWLLAHTSTD